MPKATQAPGLLEFTIAQDVLKKELAFVQTIVEKKSTIPVLSNLLIESVGENTVRITGTDLDITIRCDAEAEVQTPGSMCIQAGKLFDIVQKLDEGDVRFDTLDTHWVTLKCADSKFRLAGVHRDQFPEVFTPKSAPLSLPAKTFRHFIGNTSVAITNEQSRFTLSGAKFIISGLTALMVATDGHRLAYIDTALDAPLEAGMNVLIPKKALIELMKISADSESDIRFGEDPNHIFFEVDSRLITARKLNGNFPNYEMVMPKDNEKSIRFDAARLRKGIQRVALMADGTNRPVKLTFRKNQIEIFAQSSEEGDATDRMPAEYDGDEIEIGFNAKYLSDVLGLPVITGAGGDQKTSIHFKDSNAQTLLTTEHDTNFKYVLMPHRV